MHARAGRPGGRDSWISRATSSLVIAFAVVGCGGGDGGGGGDAAAGAVPATELPSAWADASSPRPVAAHLVATATEGTYPSFEGVWAMPGVPGLTVEYWYPDMAGPPLGFVVEVDLSDGTQMPWVPIGGGWMPRYPGITTPIDDVRTLSTAGGAGSLVFFERGSRFPIPAPKPLVYREGPGVAEPEEIDLFDLIDANTRLESRVSPDGRYVLATRGPENAERDVPVGFVRVSDGAFLPLRGEPFADGDWIRARTWIDGSTKRIRTGGALRTLVAEEDHVRQTVEAVAEHEDHVRWSLAAGARFGETRLGSLRWGDVVLIEDPEIESWTRDRWLGVIGGNANWAVVHDRRASRDGVPSPIHVFGADGERVGSFAIEPGTDLRAFLRDFDIDPDRGWNSSDRWIRAVPHPLAEEGALDFIVLHRLAGLVRVHRPNGELVVEPVMTTPYVPTPTEAAATERVLGVPGAGAAGGDGGDGGDAGG